VKFDWKPENLSKLAKMWAAGQSASVIGEHFKVSRNAVIGKVHRLGLPERKTEVGLQNARLPSGPPPAPTCANLRQPAPPLPEGDVARIQWPEEGRCKWPVGEPGEPGFGFCGLAAAGVYCPEHRQRSFRSLR